MILPGLPGHDKVKTKRLITTNYDRRINGREVISYPADREGQLAAFHHIRELIMEEAKSMLSPKHPDGTRSFTKADIIRYGMIERLLSCIDTGIVLHNAGLFHQILIHARVAIDAVARYNGIFYALDQEDYMDALLGKGSIRVCKAAGNKRMRDDYLQEVLGQKCPYSEGLYDRLCEEVHFGKTMTGRIFTADPKHIKKGIQSVQLHLGRSDRPWGEKARKMSHTLIMAVLAYRYTGPKDHIVSDDIIYVGHVE